MARAQFYDVGIDQYGNAISTTKVTVYETGTTTLVTIYENATGSTVKSNPFNSTNGDISFFAEPGDYDVKIEDTNSPASFTTRTVKWASIPHTEGVYYQTLAKDSYGPGYGAFCAVGDNYGTFNHIIGPSGFYVAPFNYVLYDIGNNYSTAASTYYYTAPLTGIYHFNVNFYVDPAGGGSVAIFLPFMMINSGYSLYMDSLSGDQMKVLSNVSLYNWDGNQQVIKSFSRHLNAGDTIKPMVVNSKSGSSGSATLRMSTWLGGEFSGYLIARTST